MRPAAKLRRSEPDALAERPPSVAGASAGCMVLAAAGRQDGLMATTVTEGEPRESRTSSATSMRWQRKLATFAECQLNGFANWSRRVCGRRRHGPSVVARDTSPRHPDTSDLCLWHSHGPNNDLVRYVAASADDKEYFPKVCGD